MSKILSIGTAVPPHRHPQQEILGFMSRVFALPADEQRKLRFLYHQSGIETRYSVLSDYGRPLPEWTFYPPTEEMEPFPSLEKRMRAYRQYAAPLSAAAIRNCMEGKGDMTSLTHLITVSCTGMSAPGLDLELMELLSLPATLNRSSVNFMGCYAAIHALKTADLICKADPGAKVMVVCTELCTLHFQREANADTISSSLLFADGSAAVLVCGNEAGTGGLQLENFYSEVIPKGKNDMTWELSSSGFLMTLSGYVPDLIEQDFEPLVNRALAKKGLTPDAIKYWCIHPGGKKILDVIRKKLSLPAEALDHSAAVLRDYGNMSSPTLLFVLKRMLDELETKGPANGEVPLFAAAFGPGLTMETFIARY